jgi:hypothetical protein
MKKPILTLLLLVACQAGNSQAQTCWAASYHTTPTSRFVAKADGTALDKKTGLIWKRCMEGYSWNGSSCTGSAGLATWQSALQQAAASTFAGSSSWRLPNMRELASIAERGCVNPQVNLTVFPNMPTVFIWSATPSAQSAQNAWTGGSGFQNNLDHPKTNAYGVLLVRDAP